MAQPMWRESPPYVADEGAEPSYLSRMESMMAQKIYAQQIQELQEMAGEPILPPCNWCGRPTGDWCERCHEVAPDIPAHAICSTCDALVRTCRLCRLQLQIATNLKQPTIRTCPGSAWFGTSMCSNCEKKGRGLKLCGLCRCTRYCDRRCQTSDWLHHKKFCSFLQGMQPLTFVYPWHLQRARIATVMRPWLLPAERSF